MARKAVLLVIAVLSLALAPAAVAAPPVVAASDVFPAVQGTSGPVADLTVTEETAGQLPVGDEISFRFTDSANASTLHLNSKPVASGTNGLAATVEVGTSGAAGLNDVVKVKITKASTGAPGILTVTALIATIDGTAAVGDNKVLASDSGSVVAPAATPVTVANAKIITATTPKASHASGSSPTISPTGQNQAAGVINITEPFKKFFKTGDVITFLVRDSLGGSGTIGLTGPPQAAGGGMTVTIAGLNSPTVNANDSGFKVNIVQEDPANGSASTLAISNIAYNTANAPVGPVTITAKVTTGDATEYIWPARVMNATVGGQTTTTAAGQALVQIGLNNQPASNISIAVTAGGLKAGEAFSLTIVEPGVTFASAPVASVTSGDLALASATAVLSGGNTIATWTVSKSNTQDSTIVIGPIYYNVAGTATAGELVEVNASGSAGSAFTPQTVANAKIAPTSGTTFTAVSVPTGEAPTIAAGNVRYVEAAGQQAPTGGSIVLISPYATQIEAFRTTFTHAPTATVSQGNIVLGAGTLNNAPLAIVTAGGTVNAAPQTAAIFPVTTGSATPATVEFSNISYTLGASVPPGALTGTGAVTSGPQGTGTSVAGNQYVNATNATGSSPTGQKCPGASTVPGTHIIGTAGDDTLTGTAGADVICGLGGNDTLNGAGGNDLILGGDGNDLIYGGAGNEIIFGQGHHDVIAGQDGADGISGGEGNDRIYGGAGNDRLWGVAGNDILYGNAGDDRVVGNTGADSMVGGAGVDYGYGLADDDKLYFRDGTRDARVDGGTGNDICSRDANDPVDECP